MDPKFPTNVADAGIFVYHSLHSRSHDRKVRLFYLIFIIIIFIPTVIVIVIIISMAHYFL